MLFFKKRQQSKNRRGTHRSDPLDRIVEAHVLFEGGASLAVKVLDSSGGGARIAWLLREGPRPAIESTLRLVLRLADAIECHEIEARVARVLVEGEALDIGLDFVDPRRDLAGLRDVDRPLFDRRKHPRYRPNEDVWVDFSLGPICLCGCLVDLAVGGLAMRLASGLAGTLVEGASGVLTFRLPGDFINLMIEAEVRNRLDDAQGTRLGLLFIAEDEEVMDRLRDYLATLPRTRKV